jgi:hypothetical protein
LNRPQLNDESEDEQQDDNENTDAAATSTTTTFVDVYLFVRSRERSDQVPEHKLGVSEMMGVFHAQSEEQLEKWASLVAAADREVKKDHCLDEDNAHDHDHDHDSDPKSMMYQSLLDVSIDNEGETWELIKEKLSALSSE